MTEGTEGKKQNMMKRKSEVTWKQKKSQSKARKVKREMWKSGKRKENKLKNIVEKSSEAQKCV